MLYNQQSLHSIWNWEDMWNGNKPTIKYFHVFGSVWYILNDIEYMQKLDPKSDELIFFGYSTSNRAYQIYNKQTNTVMESINVIIKDIEERRNTEDEETIELTSPLQVV